MQRVGFHGQWKQTSTWIQEDRGQKTLGEESMSLGKEGRLIAKLCRAQRANHKVGCRRKKSVRASPTPVELNDVGKEFDSMNMNFVESGEWSQ